MNQMISYEDIPKYCDHIDRDKRSTVVLSKFQSRLYRRMTEHRLQPLQGLAYLADMILYCGVLICVLVFARNLLLLAYFHRHNDFSRESIEFMSAANGKIAVTFNPGSEPN